MLWGIHRAICSVFVTINHSAPSAECSSSGGDAKGGVPPSPPHCAPTLQSSCAPNPAVPLCFYTLGLCWFSGICCSFFCPSHHLLRSKSCSLGIYKDLRWFSHISRKLLDTAFYFQLSNCRTFFILPYKPGLLADPSVRFTSLCD